MSVKAVAKVNPASAKEGGRESGGYGEGGDGEDESDRRGMTSIVLERAETLRTTGASIGMQSNGWHALDQLGVGLKLRQTAIPVLRILVKTLANELPVGTIRFGCQIIDVQMDPFTSLPILQLNDGTVIKAK
ncbi:unnamed protein product [Camellia sinensis]